MASSYLLPVGVGVGVTLVSLYQYSMPRCTSKARLDGKTAIVTGANAGIGFYTAQDLVNRGARVILACRNTDKANEAAETIKAFTKTDNVVVMKLDLSSMKSVREFAEQINKNEQRLDILVNNAGLSALPYQLTDEGLELTMATNHHGPFLLTNLLLDLIKTSSPSRIVNLSSVGHKWGTLDFEKINGDMTCGSGYLKQHEAVVYFVSKLCNILFTRELSKRLEGTGVTCNAVHPGSVRTQLFRNAPGYVRGFVNSIGRLFFKTPEQGAQTSIYCAVSEKVDGVTGRYFSECRFENESDAAKSDESAKKLWEISAQLTTLDEEPRSS